MAKGIKTGGRAKGAVNKVTKDVRAALAVFAEQNVDNMNTWLKRVALTDPAKALDLYLKALEYHVPKLARTEVTGKDGGALTVKVVRFGSE